MLRIKRPLYQLFRSLEGGGRSSSSSSSSRWKSDSSTSKFDRSKVPKLNEADLEENFISGSGPGGQKVNKAVNCCQLKHLPSGIVVKVHQQRSLDKNRQIARELLVARLDNLINGDQSVESQRKRLALAHIATREAYRDRRQALKEEFKRKLPQGQKLGASNNDDNG